MKQLAFFDVDGTLIPEGQTSAPKTTIDALHKIMNQGVSVFVCTGRCYEQAKEVIDQIGSDNYICSNGQEVCYKGTIIYQNTFDITQVQELVDLFNKYQVNWGFETRQCLCIPNSKTADETKKLLEAYNFFNLRTGVDPLDCKIFQFWINGTGQKIQELLEVVSNKYSYFKWRDDLFEILPGEENKSKAIKFLINRIHEDVETYAFGDGVNDIDMIKTVDYGVAMGNGLDIVKQSARYITTNSCDNGIVNGLKMVGLLDE